MKTFERVCIKDYESYLEFGKKYITSAERDGRVTVFTNYWIPDVPVDVFAGEVVFTDG